MVGSDVKAKAEKKRNEMCSHMLQVIELSQKLNVFFWEAGIDTIFIECRQCDLSIQDADEAFFMSRLF